MSYNFIYDSKFWLAVLDVVVSAILYFVGKYSQPDLFEDLKFVIALIQPIVVTIIVGLFQVQQAALKVGRKLSAFNVPK